MEDYVNTENLQRSLEEENYGEYIDDNHIFSKTIFLDDLFVPVFQKLRELNEYHIVDLIKSIFYYPSYNKKQFESHTSLSKKIKKNFPDKNIPIGYLNHFIENYTRKGEYSPEEIINLISFNFNLIQTLEYYQNMSFQDLMMRNMKNSFNTIKDSKLIFFFTEYKFIHNFNSEELTLNNLMYLIDGPEEERRPLDSENGYYRYIPIKCKGYCQKNFQTFLEICNKEKIEINEDHIMEINSLFLKNCIFSHNFNEINYHPLKVQSKFCKDKRCQIKSCPDVHVGEELLLNFNKSQFKDILTQLNNLIKLKNENREVIKKNQISRQLKDSEKIILDYKTKPCRKGKLCEDFKKCINHHSLLERRRNLNFFTLHNKPCLKVFVEGKWQDPSLCLDGDYCSFFHTRNELFYDMRNFRKIYDCPNEQSKGSCEFYSTCAYKHSIDLNIDELYLPKTIKEPFKERLNLLENYSREMNRLKTFIDENKLICEMCRNYIVNKIGVFDCGHNLCEYCIKKELVCRTCNKKSEYKIILLKRSNINIGVCQSILNDEEDGIEDCDFYEISDEDEGLFDFSVISNAEDYDKCEEN
jgi:hypothetical protein